MKELKQIAQAIRHIDHARNNLVGLDVNDVSNARALLVNVLDRRGYHIDSTYRLKKS